MHQLYDTIAHAVCFIRRLALSWKYPCWLRETDGAYFSTLLCRLIPPLIFSHLSCSFLRPLIPRFFLSPSLPSQPYHSPFISGHLPLMCIISAFDAAFYTKTSSLLFHNHICCFPSLLPLFISLPLLPPVRSGFVAFSFHFFFFLS